jgi:ribosomal protein S27E
MVRGGKAKISLKVYLWGELDRFLSERGVDCGRTKICYLKMRIVIKN